MDVKYVKNWDQNGYLYNALIFGHLCQFMVWIEAGLRGIVKIYGYKSTAESTLKCAFKNKFEK